MKRKKPGNKRPDPEKDIRKLNRRLEKDPKYVKKAEKTVELKRQLRAIEEKIEKLEGMKKHSSGQKRERIDALLKSLLAAKKGIARNFLKPPAD